MKKIILLFMLTMFSTTLFAEGAPEAPAAVTDQSKATEHLMNEMNAAVGMPAITNYTERKMAKMIVELRDKAGLSTYAYVKSEMFGIFVFLGKCVGFGLPYSVQYTSPVMLIEADLGDGWGDMAIPQPDPNGLYMPDGLSASWIMVEDGETGRVEPVYFEDDIIISPFPLPSITMQEMIEIAKSYIRK